MFRTAISSAKLYANTQTKSAFGQTYKAQAAWFARALGASALVGYTVSEYILTDEKLDPIYQKMAKASRYIDAKAAEYGVALPFTAFAFSTPDHGLHAPHYPFAFKTDFTKGYDHAAYTRLTQSATWIPGIPRSLLGVSLNGLHPLAQPYRRNTHRSRSQSDGCGVRVQRRTER
jgi:hypothetical protein